MSFQNQGFWMGKSGCLTDNEMTCDNPSRVEPKRSRQWFMDGPEVELFPNKKQAVEVPNSNIFPGMLNSNISAWENAPNFQSFAGHVSEQLFDSETIRVTNFDDRNFSSVSTEKLTLEREVNDDPFGNDPSFGLSMSHTLEDPRSGLTYGGFRKVKVNEVKDSENHMNLSMGRSNSRENENTSAAHAGNEMDPHSISMGLTYNKEDDIVIPLGRTFGRTDNNFMSMAQTVNKIDGSLSTDQGYKHSISMMPTDQTSNKCDNNIISMGQTHNRVDDRNLSSCHVYNKGQESTVSMGHAYSKSDNSMLSIGHSYNKGESTIISFGGCDDDVNTSKRLISSYGLLLGQASVQQTEATNMQNLVYSNTDALLKTSHTPASGIGNLPQKKDDQKLTKKGLPNNFPSNVRSLLSTGMLDGVTVKYMAWSREKELRGVIQGSGYSCGCQSCNFSKVINAYEFERHAGCKTKHPNNHIYFENGKTIYGIVQELRGTPQNILFEVIQTITGSSINQKAFRIWKESFLAATRELQRIYGNDEGTQFS